MKKETGKKKRGPGKRRKEERAGLKRIGREKDRITTCVPNLQRYIFKKLIKQSHTNFGQEMTVEFEKI